MFDINEKSKLSLKEKLKQMFDQKMNERELKLKSDIEQIEVIKYCFYDSCYVSK